jgi:hypothetical protein
LKYRNSGPIHENICFFPDAGHQIEEEKMRKFKEELVRIRKEQLLNELLQQKRDLELKQLKRKSKMATSPESLVPPHDHSNHEDCGDDIVVADELQMIKDITYLQQRRMSTQIKVRGRVGFSNI